MALLTPHSDPLDSIGNGDATHSGTRENVIRIDDLPFAAESNSRQASLAILLSSSPAQQQIQHRPKAVNRKQKDGDQDDADTILDMLSRKMCNVNLDGRQHHQFDEAVHDPNSIANLFSDPYNVQSLRIALFHGDFSTAIKALVKFRKYLSIDMSPGNVYQNIDNIISIPNFISRLEFFLTQSDRPELIYETCWVITNIAAGNTDHTRTVVPLLGSLIHLFFYNSTNVQTQAAWAVGNIAGDCAEFRDQVLDQTEIVMGLQALMQMDGTREEQHQAQMVAVWAISNLARWKDTNWEKVSIFIPRLELIATHSQSTDLLSEVCWALSRIFHGTSKNNKIISELLTHNLISRLLYFSSLGDSNATVSNPALRALTNISSGEDTETQVPVLPPLVFSGQYGINPIWRPETVITHSPTQLIVERNGIPILHDLLNTSSSSLVLEVLMCVSNIAAGTKAQCMSLREGGIIAQLCAILESSGGQVVDMDKIQWKVVKETIWSLSNAVAHKIEDMNLWIIQKTRTVFHVLSFLCTSPYDSTALTKAMDLLHTLVSANSSAYNRQLWSELKVSVEFVNGVSQSMKKWQPYEGGYAVEDAKRQLRWIHNMCGTGAVGTDGEMENLVNAIQIMGISL